MEEQIAQPVTVDEYIARQPEAVRPILNRIRVVIKGAAPDAMEKISYGMPGYFLNGGLVWFGAWKRHIAVYPRTGEMDAAIPELAAYKGTKGSVHFPLNQPVPYELIGKIVKARMEENMRSRE